jgi:hypothetical protein
MRLVGLVAVVRAIGDHTGDHESKEDEHNMETAIADEAITLAGAHCRDPSQG